MKKLRLTPLYQYSLLFVLALGLANGCKNARVAPAPGREDHLALGNPSRAGTADPDNYLLAKPQFTLSYNCSRGTANWVSWHLGKAWKGAASRKDDFRPDNAVPPGCYRVVSGDYTNTGFDRGHLCPSDDRDANADDNSATFLMTNIIPQAPDLNRQTWRLLEEYCRQLVEEGNELYILAGDGTAAATATAPAVPSPTARWPCRPAAGKSPWCCPKEATTSNGLMPLPA